MSFSSTNEKLRHLKTPLFNGLDLLLCPCAGGMFQFSWNVWSPETPLQVMNKSWTLWVYNQRSLLLS